MRTKNTASEKKIVDSVTKRIMGQLTPIIEKKAGKVPQTFMVPIGFNTMMADANRRQSYGTTTSYQTLRQLSVQHETTRAAINLRKRQITQLDWDVVSVDAETNVPDEKRRKIKLAVSQIGGPGVRFRQLLDKFIEDTLVLDAFCFYKQRKGSGQLLRIIPIDPSTIKLRVDDAGMRPMPPDFAFEQWIRGQKVADLTTDEIVYEAMNPRTNTPYGLSPIEAMIVTLDASMRAMLYNLAYLSDNNIPNGFLNMPEEWTPEQIKEYKEYLDSVISSPKDQAKVFPIPSGSNYQPTTKPKDFSFKDFFDYLDRKICMVFDVAPQELGLTGQQYKENADSQETISMRKGLKPLANFIEDIMTDVIQNDLELPELRFKFSGLETKFKYTDIPTLLPYGVISIDEVRNDMGLKKLGVGNLIIQGGSITPVEIAGQQTVVSGTQTPTEKPAEPQANPTPKPQGEEQVKADLKAWMNKALNDMKAKGKVYRKFESEAIPEETKKYIESGLSKASTIEDVKAIFKGKKNPIDVLLASNKAKQMKERVRVALHNQMKPFMQTETIAAFTDEKKADINEDMIGEYFEDLDISGLNSYLNYGAEEGVKAAVSATGRGSFKFTSEKFKEWIADREAFLIDSVDETTKDWIVRMISEGKMEGLSTSEIARSISQEYDDISRNRAEMIVNTEMANASMNAMRETFKEIGFEQMEWRTSEDELVDGGDADGVCASVNGEVIKVGDEFSNGVSQPPAHPNCRCYLSPVV